MVKKEFINGARDAVGVLGIKTSHYIIAATGLVTALSWNTAIREGIKEIFPVPADELKANFIYALVMTCVLVILIWLLPDTKSELPSATRRKLEQVQLEAHRDSLLREIEANRVEMENLKQKIEQVSYQTTLISYGH